MATKAEKLSTQAYFKEARAWETSKTVASERSKQLAWYVAGAASVVAVLMSASTAILATRQPDPPVVIRVNDTTGAVDVVSRLKGGDTTYDEVTRKYWTELYVREREGYSRELAEDFYNTVGLMSSSGEQKRYAEFFTPKNPMSPLNVYGEVAKVRIAIKGSSFIKTNVLLVRYSKLIERAGADRPEVTHWAATVVYRFSGAPMSEKDRRVNPLGYQVVEYRVDPDAATAAPALPAAAVLPAPAPVTNVIVQPSQAGVQVPAIAPVASDGGAP